MGRLKQFMVAVEKTNTLIGKLLIWVNVLAISVMTFEVVMRYLLNRPTIWAHDSMTLLYAIFYILAGGYAHLHHAHVRVDVLYSRWTEQTKAFMDIIMSVFFFLFSGVLLWTTWNFYWSSQQMWATVTVFGVNLPGEVAATPWEPPLFCVKFMMPLGALMLLLQGIVWLIRDVNKVLNERGMR